MSDSLTTDFQLPTDDDRQASDARINGRLSAYPWPDGTGGLTKRELFAAMAMQSVRTVNPACTSQEIAQSAVADADALLKELAK